MSLSEVPSVSKPKFFAIVPAVKAWKRNRQIYLRIKVSQDYRDKKRWNVLLSSVFVLSSLNRYHRGCRYSQVLKKLVNVQLGFDCSCCIANKKVQFAKTSSTVSSTAILVNSLPGRIPGAYRDYYALRLLHNVNLITCSFKFTKNTF